MSDQKEQKVIKVMVPGHGIFTYHTTSHGIRKGAKVEIKGGKFKGAYGKVTKVYRSWYDRQYKGPTFEVVRTK